MRGLRFAVLLLLLPAPTAAQDTAAANTPSIYDKAWDAFTNWYDDQNNPVVQRVVFTGRYHHEFAVVEAEQGDVTEWNVRRLRLGPRITLFRHFVLHAEVELNPQEHDPFYVRFTEAHVQWSRNPELVIKIGKQDAPFTQEGATSSRSLITIDRSAVANNIWFPLEYTPGVTVSGERDRWRYHAGLYSAGAANREFGEFTGGLFVLGVIGYDFAASLGAEQALVLANYVHQDPDEDNTVTRPHEHIVSVNARFDYGRWGVLADVSASKGYPGQPNLRGFMAMPFFNVTENLQLVARSARVLSDGHDGVQLSSYENRVARGAGDAFTEGYVGVNYYFYGHRLKLQSGVSFAKMQDSAGNGGAYAGTSWVTGLRIGW